MKLTFRWFGEQDPIALSSIREIPEINGIVSAIYDVPVGEVWPREEIASLKKTITDAGLRFEVVESVPVHEDIKLGKPSRDRYIANYCENIIRLSEVGVKVICYNFMPVFDWTRTTLKKRASDGSFSLAYSAKEIAEMNPEKEGLSLPGWDESYSPNELKSLLGQYHALGEEALFENLAYFLERVIQVCQRYHVRMAIHPDDPPWPIFGLPRIVRDEKHIDRILSIVDVPENGLTFCAGSLGSSKENDVVALADKYSRADRIPFVHLRNVILSKDGFSETSAASGSLDLAGVVEALVKNGFEGYVRPDHGRMIWGEEGKPGYGLYDRALSASYIVGLFQGIERRKR